MDVVGSVPLDVLFGWVYAIIVAVLVVSALMRKQSTQSALAWSLAIVFLPVLGAVLYIIFGSTRVPRRLKRRIAHREEFQEHFDHPAEVHGVAEETRGDGYGPGRWGRVGAMLENLGEAPRCVGNRTRLYTQGLDAYRDMGTAIRAAKDHVHVQFYIFHADDVGRRAIEGLARKSEEGVTVRLIVDGVGSWSSWRLLRRLRKAGGQGTSFMPLVSLGKRFNPNLRNHRKIIVCDGEVGFFGGLNVGEEYLGRFGRKGEDWCDLHMRIEGPAVWDLQRIFVEDWAFSTGEQLSGANIYPHMAVEDGGSAQIIAGGPDLAVNPVRQAFFAAFAGARERILLATPYLVPDLALRDALQHAARAGVEVNVITMCEPGDSYLVYHCGQYYAEELAASGVRIFEYTPGFMHAKAISVDGVWAMLGTANLDNRSMYLNFEQMGVFDGPAEVAAIEEALEGIRACCTERTLEDLRDRALYKRFVASGARLLSPLL